MTVDHQTDQQLRANCQRHRVSKLELFGSAARGVFDDARSDLDFLMECQDLEPGTHADAYFGLLCDLEGLFERKFESIGEALNRLGKIDADVLNPISHHQRVIAFRNILIHGYDVIDDDVVWE